jgi:hypothetical protein
MSAVGTRLEVAALQTLLTGLGVSMVLASRRVERFRRQVTRDLLLEIRSNDGAGQQYRFHAATRRMTLPRRRVERAECTLISPPRAKACAPCCRRGQSAGSSRG